MTTATERARGAHNRRGSGRARAALAILAVVTATAGWVEACVVPVFRYALERWEPRPYNLRLRGRDGALPQLDEATAKTAVREARANLALLPTVPAATDTATFELYLPGAVVRGTAPFWSMPATDSTLPVVLDSPARTDLVNRLVGGDNAVFLLLECGDRERDQAVASLLDRELPRLASMLEIGDPDPGDASSMEWPDMAPELEVRFTWLQVARDDPREAVLTANLLATEPDLAARREPVVFPVFGRGFVPYALVGAGVNERTVRTACELAIAPCSCLLRGEVRGIHLLLSAAWDDRIGPSYIDTPAAVPLVGVTASAEDADPTAAAPPPPTPITPEATPRPWFGLIHVVALVLGVAALAAGVWTAIALRGHRDGRGGNRP